jgi:sugar O-acyltransferase (sialic acid O-acetyltransferase NeuD family)
MQRKVLVYGSKDFGYVIKDLTKQCGYKFEGFIDDYNKSEEIVGNFYEVAQNYSNNEFSIAIAIGYNNLQARWKIYQEVLKNGFNVLTLVHPQAYVSETSKIGRGSIIMAGTVIDLNANIGELSVLWPGVVVNHDSIIGENTFLSPNSTVCGFASVGEHSFIGAGTVVVNHKVVPKGSFIKAGKVFY